MSDVPSGGNAARSWLVLLLGGASGAGKTSVSYRLAHVLGFGLTEVDDFQVVLEAMTTPAQYPALHVWRTRGAEVRSMSDEDHLQSMLDYSAVMAEALALVTANHLETGTPIVLEGDFILPSLAVRPRYGDQPANGRVRALFIDEENEAQLRENFRMREGEEQVERAHVSALYGAWLRAEAARLQIPVLPARPWDTVLPRALAALGVSPAGG